MTDLDEMFEDNRRAWDQRVEVHVNSRLYDVEGFMRGDSSLNPFELELVGDVTGKRLLHLMCHFGMDTLSWHRLGAQTTGVDFSGAAVRQARALNDALGLSATFVESHVLEAREKISERFDVVFTSYGVLGWLPDLKPWARVVADSLVPGGRFVLAEFHPWVWMSQTGPDLAIRYPYFNLGPISEDTQGTYADPAAPIRAREHGWNHSLADVVNALIGAGLRIDRLDELDSTPHDIFPGLERGADGQYRFTSHLGMVPLTFGIVATRPG